MKVPCSFLCLTLIRSPARGHPLVFIQRKKHDWTVWVNSDSNGHHLQLLHDVDLAHKGVEPHSNERVSSISFSTEHSDMPASEFDIRLPCSGDNRPIIELCCAVS